MDEAIEFNKTLEKIKVEAKKDRDSDENRKLIPWEVNVPEVNEPDLPQLMDKGDLLEAVNASFLYTKTLLDEFNIPDSELNQWHKDALKLAEEIFKKDSSEVQNYEAVLQIVLFHLYNIPNLIQDYKSFRKSPLFLDIDKILKEIHFRAETEKACRTQLLLLKEKEWRMFFLKQILETNIKSGKVSSFELHLLLEISELFQGANSILSQIESQFPQLKLPEYRKGLQQFFQTNQPLFYRTVQGSVTSEMKMVMDELKGFYRTYSWIKILPKKILEPMYQKKSTEFFTILDNQLKNIESDLNVYEKTADFAKFDLGPTLQQLKTILRKVFSLLLDTLQSDEKFTFLQEGFTKLQSLVMKYPQVRKLTSTLK